MPPKISRRAALKGLLAAAAGTALETWAARFQAPRTQAQQLTPRAFLPVLSVPPRPFQPPRVVHVHSPEATSWDFSTGWYGEYIDQAKVDAMTNAGLMALTGTATVTAAWQKLLPAYQTGQKIAIKVNLTNADWSATGTAIDALIHPVNSVCASLVAAGIEETDIWVYDAVKPLPARFYGRRAFTHTTFYGLSGGDQVATWNHVDPSLRVKFNIPALTTPRWLCDQLYQASYIIDMPIVKLHTTYQPSGKTLVTLALKNHVGSIWERQGEADDNIHPYIEPAKPAYIPTYSPIVDIYANRNIAAKTVLVMGDGLYGAQIYNYPPVRWRTFENGAMNSLFFARDPVAADCIMASFIDAEWGLTSDAWDHLRYAGARGLGVFEEVHVPTQAAHIEYQRVEV